MFYPWSKCIFVSKLNHCWEFIIISVRNKQLPTCPTQVKFAGGKLIDWEGSPLDKLKFINN